MAEMDDLVFCCSCPADCSFIFGLVLGSVPQEQDSNSDSLDGAISVPPVSGDSGSGVDPVVRISLLIALLVQE